MAVDDLTVRCAPRFGSQRVDNIAAFGKPVEPLVENWRFCGSQQGEPDALKRDGLVVRPGIGACHCDYAVENPVRDGSWWTIVPIELLVGVKRQLAAENVGVEAQRFAGCTGKAHVYQR
jgi:hypothetical protein